MRILILTYLIATHCASAILEVGPPSPIAYSNSEQKLLQQLSLAQAGEAQSQYQLAQLYILGLHVAEDWQLAELWYKKAGLQGHPLAQAELGTMYSMSSAQTGKAYLSGDSIKANYWYQKALPSLTLLAEKGDAWAQKALADLYFKGRGVTRDVEKAQRLYQLALPTLRKAAEEGELVAQYTLASCYNEGKGVARDMDAAVSYLTPLVDRKCSMAMTLQARIYIKQKKRDEALALLHRAANRGGVIASLMLLTFHLTDAIPARSLDALVWIKRCEKQHLLLQNIFPAHLYEKIEDLKRRYSDAK